MANPYKPDDRVLTKHKGVEVEAAVRLIWNDEVQVRTPDGVLRWRTVKTVRPVAAETAAKETIELPPAEVPAPPAPSADTADAPATPAADEQAAPQDVQDLTQGQATMEPKTEVVSCGLPEEAAKAKRSRKNSRRR